MKKQFLLFAVATVFSISSLMAQGGRQMQTPEERTKTAMEKLARFDFKQDKRSKVETIFVDFYKAQQAAMEEMRASGSNDRQAMMEKRKQMADDRDKKLKAVFTEEEYYKWINEIEPSLRPQRPSNAPMPGAPADKKAPAEEKTAPKN